MELTDVQKDLIIAASVCRRNDGRIVVTDEAINAAHELAERGWLERRFSPTVRCRGIWTPAAELALDVKSLLRDAEGGKN